MISVQYKEVHLHIGDTIRVYNLVVESSRERTQVFEGILLSLSGRGENRMMTVRHIGAGGVGVERKWPLNASSLVKVEVKKKAAKVRRSKLYYLRRRAGKRAVRV